MTMIDLSYQISFLLARWLHVTTRATLVTRNGELGLTCAAKSDLLVCVDAPNGKDGIMHELGWSPFMSGHDDVESVEFAASLIAARFCGLYQVAESNAADGYDETAVLVNSAVIDFAQGLAATYSLDLFFAGARRASRESI